MKKLSHSEITTYLQCQKKWDLIYNHKIKLSNPDFEFGEVAHKVMETGVIPSEELYPELKEHFGITSWYTYFSAILDYLRNEFKDLECIGHEIPVENDGLKGIIDVVYKDGNGDIYLCDYKFTKQPKTLDDLCQDEQLYIYSYLYSVLNQFDFDKIHICYLSFPKTQIDEPRLLSNGKLSKDKAQNTTQALYKRAITKYDLQENDYEDILDYLASKPLFSKVDTIPNIDYLSRILENIDYVRKDMGKGYLLEKNGYDCKWCPYFKYCKR